MSVRTSTLSNGMRIVTHHMPHLETVSLGVWIGTGTRSEQPAQHGIAHLLEHMAFKGTANRSARDIAEEIESVGGELNAGTSLESTAFFAKVLKADVPVAVDILADILQNPRFHRDEIAREQEVIVQEIAEAEDCPDDVVFDLAQEAAYPGQALGRTILGTRESVRGVTPDDLAAYLKAGYAPGAMVLGAAGAVDHDALAGLAETAFARLETHPPPHATEPARYSGGARRSEKPFEQTHLMLAFEGPSYRDEDIYAGQVLSIMLGGGMSSRLFQEARENRGLCYSIYSYCWGMSDTGLFGIHAATGADQVAELADVVAAELERIAHEHAGDAEIARAKAQLKAGLLMSLESSSARAEQMARQTLIFGEPLGVEALIGKVEAVGGETVRDLAGRIVTGTAPSLATVGPLGDPGSVDRLMQRLQGPAVHAAE